MTPSMATGKGSVFGVIRFAYITLMQGKHNGRINRIRIHILPVFFDGKLYPVAAVILVDDGVIVDPEVIAVDGTFSQMVLNEGTVFVIFLQRNGLCFIKQDIVRPALIDHIGPVFPDGLLLRKSELLLTAFDLQIVDKLSQSVFRILRTLYKGIAALLKAIGNPILAGIAGIGCCISGRMAFDVGIEKHVRNRIVIILQTVSNISPQLGTLNGDGTLQLVGNGAVIKHTAVKDCLSHNRSFPTVKVGMDKSVIGIRNITPESVKLK